MSRSLWPRLLLLPVIVAALPPSNAFPGAGGDARPPAPGAPHPKIAIVIDDFGLTYPKNEPDEAWMKLPFPMTFAVMPRSPRTRRAAEETLKAGKELIIHFPFDPFLRLELPADAAAPGDRRRVGELLDDAVKTIPGAVGLNNHRSYKATMNRPLMRWFLAELKRREPKFYFVDSRVSPKTVAFEEAGRAGVPTALNTVFLEENKHHEPGFTARMLRLAAGVARKRGSALVIGHHYWKGTFEGIRDTVPELEKEGVEFVFASQVVR